MEMVSKIVKKHHEVTVDDLSVYSVEVEKKDFYNSSTYKFTVYIRVTASDKTASDADVVLDFGSYKGPRDMVSYATIRCKTLDDAYELQNRIESELMKDRSFFRFTNSFDMIKGIVKEGETENE